MVRKCLNGKCQFCIFILSIAVAGCCTKCYNGVTEAKEKTARITIENDMFDSRYQRAWITYVDNEYISVLSQCARVKPGHHTVKLRYRTPFDLIRRAGGMGRYPGQMMAEVAFEAKANKDYEIRIEKESKFAEEENSLVFIVYENKSQSPIVASEMTFVKH